MKYRFDLRPDQDDFHIGSRELMDLAVLIEQQVTTAIENEMVKECKKCGLIFRGREQKNLQGRK